MCNGQNRITEYVMVKKALEDIILWFKNCKKIHNIYFGSTAIKKTTSEENMYNNCTKQLTISKVPLYGYHSRQMLV